MWKQVLKRDLIIPAVWFAILIYTANNFFFWDTIQLSSKQAHFFYDNNFSNFFLPQEINSGHPPFYGIALAVIWKLVGKSLIVSHLFNTLFVLGSIFQAHRIGRELLGSHHAFWVPLVLFCNPVFLGHAILVSPDNALIFFLLLTITSLMKRQNFWFYIATIFLALVSMRGMMVVFAIGLCEGLHLLFIRKWSLKHLVKFMPSALAATSFLVSHYLHNRWIGFHDDSPWQESFTSVSVQGYLRNCGIIGWRLLDFGNAFLWLGLLIPLLSSENRRFVDSGNKSLLISIALTALIVFLIPLAFFKYINAHRYFMPLYLVLSVGFIYVTNAVKQKSLIRIIVLIGLFCGNFWVYPRSISQGWDVSLAHLPFHDLVAEMHEEIEVLGINTKEIGTEFPLKSDARFLYLDEDIPTFQEGIVGEHKYILYSKVINDYKDTDFEYLEENYTLLIDLSKGNIDLKLYEKN